MNQSKPTGWITPINTSRSPVRKYNQMKESLKPFNVLSEGSTSTILTSHVTHGGSTRVTDSQAG